MMPGLMPGGSDLRACYESLLEWKHSTAAAMPDAEAIVFSERVDHHVTAYLDMADAVHAEAAPPQPTQPPANHPRQSGGGYVERTFIRALIWNSVNAVFRAFR
jgi:hypothetical protein